jgi:heme A synthase
VSRFAKLAWYVLVYNLGVVLWGAWVRISGSGAGCGEHWPDCNGQVLPRDPSIETLIEFTHRATSGIALLLTVALVIAAWRGFGRGHRVRRAAITALGFMLAEALLGAGLVIFGLVADDASPARAVVMSIHLLNTFCLLGGMTLTAWWASDDAPIDASSPRRRGLWLGASLIFAVGITGAIAALGDTLFPATSLLEGITADLDPASHFLLRLRSLHPVVALVCAGVLWVLASRWPSRPGRWLQVLVGTQILAGLVNLVLLAPGWLQLVHLLLADLVLVVFVVFAAVSLRRTTAPETNASGAA